MKNIIKFEDTEYIKLSKYNKLKETKTPKVKVVKEIEKIKFSDYGVLEPANVLGIFPFIKKDSDEDVNELKTDMGFFKKYDIDLGIQYFMDENWNVEIFEINGSRYSKEYLDKSRKMANVFFDDKPKILMRYDKEKEKWLKGQPIMFLFDNRLCFILAPRVDSDSEVDEE